MSKRANYKAGDKFSGWTLISFAWVPENKVNARWLCRCECGAEKELIVGSVVHGGSQSCGCMSKQTVEGLRVKTIIKQLKMNAKRRNKTFNLEYADIARLGTIQEWKCAKTGIKLDMRTGVKLRQPYGPSIDRIDSSKGYERGNVQLVCNIYNLCKSNFDESLVIDFAKTLIAYQEEQNGRISVVDNGQ